MFYLLLIFVTLIVAVALHVVFNVKKLHLLWSSISHDQAIEIPCLDRNFKLGMLYDLRNESLLKDANIWKKEATDKQSDSCEKTSVDVFSEDSMMNKFQTLGISDDMALSLVSESVQGVKASRYFSDRKSPSIVRVILRYQYTKKVKKVIKPKLGFSAPDIARHSQSATHVIVGIQYGGEAFFVFDKDISENEDYDTVTKNTKSLVQKLPSMAQKDYQLTQQEQMLADELHCKFYSDFPILQTPSTFNESIHVYKVLPNHTNIDNPKKAWLYPLKYITTRALTFKKMDRQLVKTTLESLDSLIDLELRINVLMGIEIYHPFTGIQAQLAAFKDSVKHFREKIRKQIQLFRESQYNSEEVRLQMLLKESDPVTRKKWLEKKKKELTKLSYYLCHLQDQKCIQCFLRNSEFNRFLQDKEATYCAVIFKILLGQKEVFDLEEEPWYNNTQITSYVENEIEQFTKFANSFKHTNCIVTISHDPNPTYDEGAFVYLHIGRQTNIQGQKFEFPKVVEKLKFVHSNWSSIKISWTVPSGPMNQLTHYIIYYKESNNEGIWKEIHVPGSEKEANVERLNASTTYSFKIAAKYQFGLGPESQVSDGFSTAPLPLANKIALNEQQSEKLPAKDAHKQEAPSIQVLRLITTDVMEDSQKMIAKKEFGIPLTPTKPMKVVMVMGATGAGKSTLINGMVNYILGVKWEDDFRFKLICDDGKSQANSVTNLITAYTFHWQEGFAVPYSLTIIDTPGFGDTRGIDRDKLITKQVKELFSLQGDNGIDTIHGIGFVTQSALARLTPTQKYVFDSILSIFGNDIKNNIFIMATFADGAIPPVIEAVKAADVPVAESFPFNNSALYESRAGKFTEMFWDMGCESFRDFFTHLDRADPVSLQLTREVLKEREQLEALLNSIQPKIQEGLSTIDTLRSEESMLRASESDVLANKDFKYDIKVTKQRKVNLPSGTFVTNCLTCNFTCHRPCSIAEDSQKYRCAAMDNGGVERAKCKACPKKCSWKVHCNNPYYFELYEEIETRTSDDLLQRYNIAKDDKNAVEAVITKLHDDLAMKSKDVYEDIREARRCIERLSQIALKPNPMSEVQYIELLIESEKKEQRVGFKDRVQSYMKMKSQAELMSRMTEQQIDEEFKKPDKKRWWQIWIDTAKDGIKRMLPGQQT